MPDIKPIIKSAIKDLFRNNYERRIGVYRASESWGCLFKRFYRYKMPTPPEKKVKEILNSGTLWHNFLELEVIKAFPERFEAELELSKKFDSFEITGHVDLYDKVDKVIYDFKTTGNIFKLQEEPLSKHYISQVNTYWWLMDFKPKKAFLVFIDRVDPEIVLDFEVKLSKRIVRRVLDNFVKLHYSLVNNVEPEPNPTEEWECRYCEFKTLCPLYNANKKLDQTLNSLEK